MMPPYNLSGVVMLKLLNAALVIPVLFSALAPGVQAESGQQVDKVLIAKKDKSAHSSNGGWQQSMDGAIAQAQQTHKLVFVDIGAKWCPSCQFLEKKIFPKPKVRDFLSSEYVPTHLDADTQEGQIMLKRYGLNGIPALFVFDESGKLRGMQSGAPQDVPSFIQTVQRLSHGNGS